MYGSREEVGRTGLGRLSGLGGSVSAAQTAFLAANRPDPANSGVANSLGGKGLSQDAQVVGVPAKFADGSTADPNFLYLQLGPDWSSGYSRYMTYGATIALMQTRPDLWQIQLPGGQVTTVAAAVKAGTITQDPKTLQITPVASASAGPPTMATPQGPSTASVRPPASFFDSPITYSPAPPSLPPIDHLPDQSGQLPPPDTGATTGQGGPATGEAGTSIFETKVFGLPLWMLAAAAGGFFLLSERGKRRAQS